MKKLRFWIPTIIGSVFTPVFFIAGTYSGKGPASHAGAGFQLLLFYPIPFIVATVVPLIGIILGALQFPAFGFFLSYIREYKNSILFKLISVAIWIHIVISSLVLALVLYAMIAER